MSSKLVLALVLAPLSLAAGAVATAADAGGGDGGRTFTVRDVAVQQELVDLAATGPSLGDRVVFNDVLKLRAGGRVIGRLYGECTLTKATEARQAFHCEATSTFRAGGTIEVSGMVFLVAAAPDRRNVLAITGGSGRFRGASGQAVLRQASLPVEFITYQLDG